MALQQAQYPSSDVSEIIFMTRSTSAWCSSAHSGVNQLATTVGAIAAVPTHRTEAARSRYGETSSKRAVALHNTSEDSRSGACAASRIPTMPPRERPH